MAYWLPALIQSRLHRGGATPQLHGHGLRLVLLRNASCGFAHPPGRDFASEDSPTHSSEFTTADGTEKEVRPQRLVEPSTSNRVAVVYPEKQTKVLFTIPEHLRARPHEDCGHLVRASLSQGFTLARSLGPMTAIVGSFPIGTLPPTAQKGNYLPMCRAIDTIIQSNRRARSRSSYIVSSRSISFPFPDLLWTPTSSALDDNSPSIGTTTLLPSFYVLPNAITAGCLGAALTAPESIVCIGRGMISFAGLKSLSVSAHFAGHVSRAFEAMVGKLTTYYVASRIVEIFKSALFEELDSDEGPRTIPTTTARPSNSQVRTAAAEERAFSS
ncbi:hypothetical protein C8F04DRAFT_1256862 [Mycena alexandri]|uniref:Uncharacterized protein n=1 Tax=Mycena alexandri TaxID=1745969 RepID=A0AAD6X3I5_9AGAR|nr:hypothetical protein C8F04DRAFT_1256862 [Mycena alexandri]